MSTNVEIGPATAEMLGIIKNIGIGNVQNSLSQMMACTAYVQHCQLQDGDHNKQFQNLDTSMVDVGAVQQLAKLLMYLHQND